MFFKTGGGLDQEFQDFLVVATLPPSDRQTNSQAENLENLGSGPGNLENLACKPLKPRFSRFSGRRVNTLPPPDRHTDRRTENLENLGSDPGNLENLGCKPSKPRFSRFSGRRVNAV